MKSLRFISLFFAVSLLVGCIMPSQSIDGYLEQKSTRYVIPKEDASLLDGPYRIIEKPSAAELIAERNSVRYKIHLRGCKTLGGLFDIHVQHSFYDDMGIYLLKDGSVHMASNEIEAIVYRPANRVYVGSKQGFENLTYVMPQILHIAYGELAVDHSDTNHPLYQAFSYAERLAQQHKKGYWETHSQ